MLRTWSFYLVILTFLLCLAGNSYSFKQNNRNTLDWRELMDSAKLCQQKQDFESALKLAKQSLPLAEKEFGNMDTNYTASLSKIAEIFYYNGKFDSSLYYFEICLNKYKEIFKSDHPDIVNCLSWIAYLYQSLGKLIEAEPIYIEILEIKKRLFRGDHPEIAMSLNNLANLYNNLGRLNEAEALYKEILEMRRRLFGDKNPDVAASLNNLANLYNDQGRLNEAEPLFKKALEINRLLFNGDHYSLAMSINNLASIFQAQGRLSDAEPLKKEASEMYRRLFNGDHPDVAMSINNLAYLYHAQGRLSEAEPLYKESLEMFKRLFIGDHPDVAMSLNNLATLYNDQGRLSDAEPLFKEASEVYRRLYKYDHPDVALGLNNLAALYQDQGRLGEAELLFKEASDMYRHLFNGDHPDVAMSLNNLAYLFKAMGRLNDAEPLFKEASEMYSKLYKGNHPYVALSLNNLADLYQEQNRLADAEVLFKQALEMYRQLFKGDHPSVAMSLNNLADLYQAQDRLGDAEPLYKEASEMYRRIYKGDHPSVAMSLNNLADLYQAWGRLRDAEPLKNEALEMIKNIFIKQSINLSEKEKENYWNTIKNGFVGFNSYAVVRMKENPLILNDMFDNLVFYKSILYNTSNKIKKRILHSRDSSLIKKYRELISKKEILANWYSTPREELESNGRNVDSLERIANGLEKEISRKSELFAQSIEKKKITWKSIQTILKPEEAAVELVRFRLYVNRRWTDTVYYAALIITEQTENYPELVLLENGKDLEGRSYTYYRKCIKSRISDNESFGQYWGKIYDKIKDYKKVFFSPDGIYNKLNLSSLLMPNGNYLLDEQEIQTLVSSRDILSEFYTKQKESNVFNSAVLFGNPDFNIKSSTLKKIEQKYTNERSADNIDTKSRNINLSPLPGTEKEVNLIASYLKSKSWKINKHQKEDAVKAALKSVDNPRVLHIATHGLFLSDINPEKEMMYGIDTKRALGNPLLRSGLFFAGAATAVNEGFNPSGSENGFLTAYEAQNLDLDHTELVVLSACETGLGEIINGEGVLGLQRAFQQAGAKSVLMSLWKVDDAATQLLMTTFYSKWLSGKTKREAFREAQLEIKAKYQQPYFWGAFVMVGE